MKELTYKSDFAASTCGPLERTTSRAVARQFAGDPTSENGSLLLSLLLQDANSDWKDHPLSIEDRGGIEECAINTLFNALHEMPFKMKNFYAQDIADCSPEITNTVESDDLWIRRIVLSGATLLEEPLSEEKTKFFVQYICYFIENRLGCETIKRLVEALREYQTEGAL